MVESDFVRMTPPVIYNPGAAILDAGGWPSPVANPVGVTGPVQVPDLSGGWPRPIANPVFPVAPVQVLADYPGSTPTASGAVPVTTTQSGGLLSSLPGWLVLAVLALGAVFAFGQAPDSTLYVRHFSGSTVGDKLTNAIAACNPDTAIHCILVLDPSLKAMPEGTLPALCSQCDLADYRNGLPWAGGPGPGSGCGAVAGDATSLDCGTGNRVGDATPAPAYVLTMGNNNGTNANNTTYSVILGNDNNQNDGGFSNDVVAIGHGNGTYAEAFDSVILGRQNALGDSGEVCVPSATYIVGDNNYSNCKGTIIQDSFIAGSNNMQSQEPASYTEFSNVVIGTFNGEYEGVDKVGISNATLLGNTNGDGITDGADVIGIGDNTCNNSHGVPLSLVDVVCVGDAAGKNLGDGSHDSVLIGDSAGWQQHNQNAANVENVYIGDSAGKNAAGSENVAIGHTAHGTTGAGDAFSNTVAIGKDAEPDQSNELVLGNSSYTKAKIFGCPAGEYALTDGSGTCTGLHVAFRICECRY